MNQELKNRLGELVSAVARCQEEVRAAYLNCDEATAQYRAADDAQRTAGVDLRKFLNHSFARRDGVRSRFVVDGFVVHWGDNWIEVEPITPLVPKEEIGNDLTE